jgi:hypothetical protein
MIRELKEALSWSGFFTLKTEQYIEEPTAVTIS